MWLARPYARLQCAQLRRWERRMQLLVRRIVAHIPQMPRRRLERRNLDILRGVLNYRTLGVLMRGILEAWSATQDTPNVAQYIASYITVQVQ